VCDAATGWVQIEALRYADHDFSPLSHVVRATATFAEQHRVHPDVWLGQARRDRHHVPVPSHPLSDTSELRLVFAWERASTAAHSKKVTDSFSVLCFVSLRQYQPIPSSAASSPFSASLATASTSPASTTTLASASSPSSRASTASISSPRGVLASAPSADAPYRSIPDVIRRTYAREGLSGFYKGIATNAVRILPGTCVTFVVYEQMSRFLGRIAEERQGAAGSRRRPED
jgi:hypothetical protein